MKLLKIIAIVVLLALAGLAILFYEGDIPAEVVDARYTSPTSQFLNLGENGRIHFRDEGNHRAPALVLLHGSNASLHTFEPWVNQLGDDYRLVSIDLPGHGLTGAIPSDNYALENFVATVHRVAEHLQLKSFAIAGNSMGGAVAWQYAITYPNEATALVLIDTAGVPVDRKRESAVPAFALLQQPWFRSIAVNIDPYYLIEQGLRASFVNQSLVDEDMVHRYYKMNLREGTRQATIRRFEQSGNRRTIAAGDITIPTLIMWGKEDAVIPFAYGQKLEELIPQAKTAYYDNVGHIPMEEVPEQSAADVADFLATLNAGIDQAER